MPGSPWTQCLTMCFKYITSYYKMTQINKVKEFTNVQMM